MTTCCAIRRRLLLAGAIAGLFACSAAAQAPPGFSPLDKSSPGASKQDTNLKPHPTPPIAAAPDKLPVDKLKLPAGFKAEVWSHGHPGARTMVMGPKGTIFMGSRLIGRVYAITERNGKRVWYAPAVGTDPHIADVIVERVREAWAQSATLK